MTAVAAAAVLRRARRAAYETGGTTPAASTVATLRWLDDELLRVARPSAPSLFELVRDLEARARVVPPSRCVSSLVLLAAADAVVEAQWSSAPTTEATMWVMARGSHEGLDIMAVTADGRRFLSAPALGRRWARPKLYVDVADDACEAATDHTRTLEDLGYGLLGPPRMVEILDVDGGSLVALVRSSIRAGWPAPHGWPIDRGRP